MKVSIDYKLAEQIMQDIEESLKVNEDHRLLQEKIRLRINWVFDCFDDWVDDTFTFPQYKTVSGSLNEQTIQELNEVYQLNHRGEN